MKRATNTLFSVIMLTMILLGTSGVSLEKCSCTGKISLVLPTGDDCCPDEGDCMTLKSMQLSDYIPTMTAGLDIPVLPVLFTRFSDINPTLSHPMGELLESHCAKAPPEALAHTVTVMRV